MYMHDASVWVRVWKAEDNSVDLAPSTFRGIQGSNSGCQVFTASTFTFLD